MKQSIAHHFIAYKRRKLLYVGFLFLVLIVNFGASLSIGAYNLSIKDVFEGIFGSSISHYIVMQIRMPKTLTAIVVGAGLSLCGAVLQIVLKNPLASPFTLGISSASAFGAACAILGLFTSSLISKNPYFVSFSAFVFSFIATMVIMLISKLKNASSETLILSGVALSALFNAMLALAQYFSSDSQIAAIVFWMFGDCGRTNYRELLIITCALVIGFIYFAQNSLNYKLMLFGDDQAKSLGVNTQRLRLNSLVVASLMSASFVSFVGIIGFIGLLGPHIAKRIIGSDYLLLSSALVGANLLILSDIVSRLAIHNVSLPVGIVTSFIGAPAFFYLIIAVKNKI